MKKRHEQKLVILGISLALLFNAPLVLIFNGTSEVWGIPIFFFSIFSIWLISVVVSYVVLKKHYE